MLINFQALGCRLNEAEVETWASQFVQRGYQLTAEVADADVVVFNSCAVTANADRKSRQQIGRLQRSNPHARLVVTGCHASLNREQVRQYLGVDLVVDNRDKDRLVEQTLGLLGRQENEAAMPQLLEDAPNALLERGRHRAFVKVQDGCRYRCTYCVVTLARGEERSRGEAEILAEINRLHAQGIQEVALTGVHVGGYGSDTGSSLYRLLGEILERTAIPRIRLASVEPWDLPAEFFGLFANPRLMPHMHLPLQSGCNSVLRRMARRCKTAEFRALVDRARSAVPRFNITTDLIVGFPGESEQEWQQTLRFVADTGFGHIHIFPFSPRAGTKAARLGEQVDAQTKKARCAEMQILAAELKRQALRGHLGQRAEVLWERRLAGGSEDWLGYTPHYHKIRSSNTAIEPARILEVGIDSVSSDGSMLVNEAPRAQLAVADLRYHVAGA